jgi:nucleoid DNA-binding protein
MTDTSTLAPRTSEKPTSGSYVEWSAIFAGAIVASAIVVLMTAFGSAIGLSLVSPYKGQSAILFYVALALWFIWITISSFVAGGYIAGRMRRPIEGVTIHESQIRDGVHGLVVWAVAVAIGTWLATWTISSAVKGGAELAKSGASSISSGATSGADPLAYSVDTLLRPGENASTAKNGSAETSQRADTSQRDISSILATSATNGSLSADDRARVAHMVAARDGLQEADAENRVDGVFAQVKAAADKVRNANDAARKAGIALALKLAPNAPGGEAHAQGADKAMMGESGATEASRQEVSRILLTGAAEGSLSGDDHAYLVRLVAAHTGLSQADAEKRVDTLIEQMKAAADKARKAGILLAFLTAATLVVGAAAAWWGAGVGGRHRDEKFDASHLTRW